MTQARRLPLGRLKGGELPHNQRFPGASAHVCGVVGGPLVWSRVRGPRAGPLLPILGLRGRSRRTLRRRDPTSVPDHPSTARVRLHLKPARRARSSYWRGTVTALSACVIATTPSGRNGSKPWSSSSRKVIGNRHGLDSPTTRSSAYASPSPTWQSAIRSSRPAGRGIQSEGSGSYATIARSRSA